MMHVDERAQSAAIGASLATLLFVGIVYTIANQFMEPLRQSAVENVGNETAVQGIQYTGQVWDAFLFVALAVVTLGTIALAVYQRQGGMP